MALLPPFPKHPSRTEPSHTRFIKRAPSEKRLRAVRRGPDGTKRTVNLSHGYRVLSRSNPQKPKYTPKTHNVHARAKIAKVILERRDVNRS